MSKTRDVVKQIRRATRRKFSAEEKIRIVLEGLRGEIPVSELAPSRRDCSNRLLPLVEVVSGGGQKWLDQRHEARLHN